jgi:hypothetical protein
VIMFPWLKKQWLRLQVLYLERQLRKAKAENARLRAE